MEHISSNLEGELGTLSDKEFIKRYFLDFEVTQLDPEEGEILTKDRAEIPDQTEGSYEVDLGGAFVKIGYKEFAFDGFGKEVQKGKREGIIALSLIDSGLTEDQIGDLLQLTGLKITSADGEVIDLFKELRVLGIVFPKEKTNQPSKINPVSKVITLSGPPISIEEIFVFLHEAGHEISAQELELKKEIINASAVINNKSNKIDIINAIRVYLTNEMNASNYALDILSEAGVEEEILALLKKRANMSLGHHIDRIKSKHYRKIGEIIGEGEN